VLPDLGKKGNPTAVIYSSAARLWEKG